MHHTGQIFHLCCITVVLIQLQWLLYIQRKIAGLIKQHSANHVDAAATLWS